jgi:hypothetical protein
LSRDIIARYVNDWTVEIRDVTRGLSVLVVSRPPSAAIADARRFSSCGWALVLY